MLKVKNITLEEYRNIIHGISYPLSFDGKWIDTATDGKAIYMSIEDETAVLALFVACLHRRAIITTPFCKYQGWILLSDDIKETQRYEIAKATISALPKHYYFNLNISESFLPQNLLKEIFSHEKVVIKENHYQVLFMDKICTASDLNEKVSKDLKKIHHQAISTGFEINYEAFKEEVLQFARLTAQKKGYKSGENTLASLMEINNSYIKPLFTSVSHSKLWMPSMGMFIVKHRDVAYCISCGYNTEVRKRLGIYQPNLFLFCLYDYLVKNIGNIEKFDFQGSSIPAIEKRNMKFSPINVNYINIEYGNRYNPLRLI